MIHKASVTAATLLTVGAVGVGPVEAASVLGE